MFFQIFIDREYDAVKPRSEPDFILDCGANVGYTAAYLLTRFPNATLIAVEPDPENAIILRRNVAPYQERVDVKETAIWSHSTGLVLVASTDPQREFARQVREASADEVADLSSTDIATLIAQSGRQRVGLLKIDIEGAETVVFNHCATWIHLVDTIAVELHSDEARHAFSAAVHPPEFEITNHGELTIAYRQSNGR